MTNHDPAAPDRARELMMAAIEIAVRFTTSYIMGNASEILAYGEAALVEQT